MTLPITTKTKGDLYENQILQELRKSSEAYLWKDIPQKYLIESNLLSNLEILRINRKNHLKNPQTNSNPLRDIGFDILQITPSKKFTYIQCKAGYEKGVTISDLSGMYARLFNNPHLDGEVYYTDKLSQNLIDISKNNKLKFTKIKLAKSKTNVKINNNQKVYILKDYQQKAVNDIVKFFKPQNVQTKGIFSAPCGVGKTLVAYNSSLGFKYVIIFAPYRQHAQQNLDRFKEYNNGSNNVGYILIDSDGTRDIAELKTEIKSKKYDRIVFSATFKSVDVVNKILSNLGDNYIAIIDEFHNLSKSNVGFSNKATIIEEDEENEDNDDDESENNADENTDEFYKLITTAKNILFMSATPRIYEIEGSEDVDTMDEILGPSIFNMSINEALVCRATCNFKTFIVSVSENKQELINNVAKEVDIRKIDNQIKAKCIFLYKGLQLNGNKKCIVYCRNKAEVAKFADALKTFDEYYALGTSVYSITSDDFYSKDREDYETNSREWKLEQFVKDPNISIILSVRILDECIDISKCDSIFITYPSQSKIRTIQRIFRCTRLDPDNPQKVGCVYIWCDEYNELLDMLGGIKEYDLDFKTKISIMSSKLGTSEEMNNSAEIVADVIKLDKCIIGVREYHAENWQKNLDEVDKFIDDKKCRPSITTKNQNEKRLAWWLYGQLQNYKLQLYIMSQEYQRKKFEDFLKKHKKYFVSLDDKWYNTLNKCKEYIKINNMLPQKRDKNPDIKYLGKWLDHQKLHYKANAAFTKDAEKKKAWENFVEEHSNHFMSIEEYWIFMFNKVVEHMHKYNARPSSRTKIGEWLQHQLTSHKNNTKLMKSDIVKSKFKSLLSKYPDFFVNYIKNDSDSEEDEKLQKKHKPKPDKTIVKPKN